jgi:hypothetical protein
VGQGEKAESRVGEASQHPRLEVWQISELVSVGLKGVHKTEFPHLAGKEDDQPKL